VSLDRAAVLAAFQTCGYVNGEPVLVGKHATAAKRQYDEAFPCVS